MKKLITLVILTALWSSFAHASSHLKPGDVAVGSHDSHVNMTIITQKGFLKFSIKPDWPVLLMKTQPPVTASVFQIPNPSDKKSSDSTNLIINLYDKNSKEAMQALQNMRDKRKGKASKHRGWKTYSQEDYQGDTRYTIKDAEKTAANVHVTVRIAWPHLPNNPGDYSKKMNQTFLDVLDSIEGNVGHYQVKQGEVVRRPE